MDGAFLVDWLLKRWMVLSCCGGSVVGFGGGGVG